jgi:cytochrome oxidase assembly protein ShyY1
LPQKGSSDRKRKVPGEEKKIMLVVRRLVAPGGAVAQPLRRLSSAASTAATFGESTSTRRLGVLLFGGGLCGGTALLCKWQVERYSWKVQLIEERRAALASSPRPLSALVPDPAAGLSDAAEYQRVTVEGQFDHSQQVLLGPRSAPAGSGVGGGVAGDGVGASGWDVVTPLTCADGVRVLVNRGWVPRDGVGQPAAVEQPVGVQVVSGVLKAGEARNKYATNDVARGRFVWLDLPTLADATDSSPILLVAASDAPPAAKRWPHARPLDAFLQFHVTPSTHAVRSCPVPHPHPHAEPIPHTLALTPSPAHPLPHTLSRTPSPAHPRHAPEHAAEYGEPHGAVNRWCCVPHGAAYRRRTRPHGAVSPLQAS